jgi:hypothetical protein
MWDLVWYVIAVIALIVVVYLVGSMAVLWLILSKPRPARAR